MRRGGGSGRKRKEGWFQKINADSNETCLAATSLGPYL